MVAAAIAPSVYDAKAANKKVTVIQDDITMTTLTGGNWQVKSDTKIEYRTSGGTTVKLGGYETAGNNVNCFATKTSVKFADDEDLMAEYDVLGVTSKSVHFGVMQGRNLGDSSAWNYNYGYVNTFGYYAGADSTSFTFESASAAYKFPDVYENGAWVKATKGNLDLTGETSYRIRQVYRSAATGEENAIEIFVAPLSDSGTYDWNGENVKRYRVTANQVASANSNGFQNFKIGDGYVGINVEDVGVNGGDGVILDNVKFSKISSTGYDIKSVIAQTDFEDKKLPSTLITYGLNTRDCLSYIYFSDVNFNGTKSDDLLFSTMKIAVDEKADKIFEGSFDINVNENTQNGYIGVAFGLETAGVYNPAALTAGIELANGTAKAVFKRSGETIATSEEIALTRGEYQNISVSAVFDDNGKADVTLTSGGKSVTAKVESGALSGYFALGNFSDNAAEFYIDNILLERYVYAESAGKNLTADFNDNAVSDDWFYQTGSSVELSNDILPNEEGVTYTRNTADCGLKFENGTLRFDRTGDSAMFGPKRSYGDWQFKFDLLQYQYEPTSSVEGDVTVWTPQSMWFGFSFHKGSYKSNFAASSVYSLMMGRKKATDPNKSFLTLFGWNIPSYSGSVETPVNAPVDAPISIRVTAVNSTVTVEFKLLNENDTEWKPVVSFGDTDTVGYMSFSSTNWTNFTVDNVSVKNLDKYYEEGNYPDLVISGDSRQTFNAASPKDLTFNVNVGKYTFELLGSKITENDYIVDEVDNTITIKKEFLQKFPSGTRNFYIRNQFGEELRVVIDIRNDGSSGQTAKKSGCGSSVGMAAMSVFALPAALFVADKKRRQK